MKSLVRNHKCVVSVLLTLLIVFGTYSTGYTDITPVSNRTSQVRDAIVAAVPVDSAVDVTEAHLADISTLNLSKKNITALKEGDFDGLSSLQALWLGSNQLSSLPAGIFSGLSSLTTITLPQNQLSSLPAGVFNGLSSLTNLRLDRNNLSSLPAGVFSGLSSLEDLQLNRNNLNSLPAGIFSGLSSLTTLNLGSNQLSSLPAGTFSGLSSLTTITLGSNQLNSLPAGIFSGLSSLTKLGLHSNNLSSLPAGIFSGLSSLTTLNLEGNAAEFSIIVLLQEVATNQFKAIVHTGAPFNIVVPLNVMNGSIDGGGTTVTIPIGSVESEPFTVTPTPGTSAATTVEIGTLPSVPSGHNGYSLAQLNRAPEFTEGASATRTVAEDTTAGVNIGIPVSATDINNDPLTYALSGTDASFFTFNTTTGQLRTSSILDYETKSIYTVTVTVTDGSLTSSITVTINVSDVEPESLLNVGTPRTVRLFYLLPNDKPYRAEVVEAMKSGILEIQSFFREQMEAHGHGSKTFEIETDDQGDPIVHRVDGDYPESEYQGRTKGEIKKTYDNSQNVILIVLDISTGSGAHGRGVSGKSSGWAMIYGGWHWFAAAHELGHAFGLHHDFRDTAYIMGYNRLTRSAAQLSAGAAEFLAVNPYFNSDIPLKNESPPTLELLSPKFYPHNAKRVPIRLRVRDADGLYQVMLLVSTKRILGAGGSEVKEFRKLAGETDTIIEFNYDGITPSDRTYSSPPYTSLADPLQHPIGFLFTDMLGNNEGNVIYPRFVFEGKNINTDVPVSQRTPQVRDAIVAAVPGVNNANDVTKTHLATITNLDLNKKDITSLKLGDFHGLTGLTTLDLSGNYFWVLPFGIFNNNTKLTSLSLNRLDTVPYGTIDNLTNLTELHLSTNSLPTGILDNLTNLTELHLSTNSLPTGILDNLTNLTELHLTFRRSTGLPDGIFDNLTNLTELHLTTPTLSSDIFDNLTNLTELYLNSSNLSSLPDGIFDELTALTTLNLSNNDLTSLPSGIFDNNTALTTLHLEANDLSSLPDGIFKGLTQLNLLYLWGNRHYTMPLPVSLEKVRKNQVKAVAPTGAPFKIVLPITVKNGSVSGGASSITIPIGSVESETLTVVRTPGTTAAVTVDIGTLPRTPLNSGYTLVKSDDLPLEFNGIDVATNNAPVFTDGTSTTRSIAENTASGQNIGTAIAATDADTGDTLTYTLSGTDAASFSIISTSGQLQTRAALDYETKTSYSVTITVSDGNGGTDSITVTINVTDVNETTITPVSGRTPAVRNAIVAAFRGVNSPADVTEAHLAAIRSLNLSGKSITALKAGDFEGMSGLTSLFLHSNQLTSLPAGVFDGLAALTQLDLDSNQLTSLPIGVFDELSALTVLGLSNNQLTTLPAGVFDELTALTNLVLHNNQLTSLSAGVFDGLAALTQLQLNNNQLATLPTDVFDELTALTNLSLQNNQLTSLSAGAFNGLTALTQLLLNNNQLTTLPAGVFDKLTALTELWLNANQLTSLPADVFDELPALTQLYLDNNQLATLSSDVFDGVSKLTSLLLNNNDLTTLPADVFDGLSALRILHLHNNELSTVSAGLFEGLAALNQLLLQGNSVNPIPLSVSLEKVADGQFKAVAPTGAPFEMVLPLIVTNGSISGGATSVTISTGKLESGILTVTRTAGTTAAVTVNIGTLPSLPTDHQGYTFLKSAGLPLKVITHTNTAPVFTDGTTATRTIAENTAANTNIGTAIAATDADTGDTLTYTLSGTDAAAFSIVSTTGQLQTKAALDYETKTSYSVTVSVSDGNGGSDSITVTINVTDVDDSTIDPPLSERTPQVHDAIVAAVPGINSAADVTAAHLAAITTLNLSEKSISSLKAGDFSGLTSLIYLYLYNNSISDISPLENLTTLKWLNLGANSISDISPLENLTALTSLYLGANSISDVSALENLTSLEWLGLRYNSISDISPLENLTSLEQLDLQHNSINDISPLENLTALTSLNLNENYTISDISVLENLTSLVYLKLERNSISDVSVLEDLTSLEDLDLKNNLISDYGPLRRLKAAKPNVNIDIDINNNPPVFSEGTRTTRSIAENTPSWRNIGAPVSATDADNDTLVYFLTGTDAAAFQVGLKTGQLRNRASVDYETKNTYSVTIIVEDGNGGGDSIDVTINVTDVPETNSAPTFTDGTTATRTIAENTAANTNIGTAIAATDADTGDTLTYSLSGTDAASFSIVSTTGQLQTKAALDYETKTSYSVTITVSDGNGGTDTITVAISVTDVNETPANTAPVFSEGNSIAITMALPPKGNTEADYDVGNPLSATDPDGDTVIFYSLSGTDAGLFNTYVFSKRVNGQNQSYVQLTTRGWSLHDANKSSFTVIVTASDRDGGSDSITVTINVAAETANNAPMFTDGTSTTRSIAENTAANTNIGSPIAATDADNDTLTYTLSGTDAASFSIVSTTGQLQTKAALDYETKSTYTVTLTVSDGSLTDTITVTVNVTDINELPTTTAICKVGDVLAPGESCTYPGTDVEFSVNNSSIGQFLFLTAANNLNIKNTELNGVSYTLVAKKLDSGSWQIEEVADKAADRETNAAPVFTDGTSTTRSIAENTAANTNIGSPIAATDADNDTLTYTLSGTDAASFSIISTTGQLQTKAALDYETKNAYSLTITVSDGSLTDTITVTINVTDINEKVGDDTDPPPDTPEQPGVVGGKPTVTASTAEPLTEATLHGSVVTLTLSGRKFAPWWDIRDAVSVSGITGVTVDEYDIDRESDTEITVEFTFDGNLTTDDTLTLTVGAGAIVGYNEAFTVQLPVSAVEETMTVSTEAPLTEATLHGSIVTLTLSGRKFERTWANIREAVSVSGIAGVTVDQYDIDRESDTEVTVELTFAGNLITDGTLTLTVGAGAIVGYNEAFTFQFPVTAVEETMTVSTEAPLTEATLHGSIVTLTLSGRKFERTWANIREAVSVSGIDGVIVDYVDIVRKSDTEVTVELTFAGNLITDGTLTLAVGAAAIVGHNEAFIFQLPVTAVEESITASTETPLTEATLHGSIVTLTLNGRKFERTWQKIRAAVSVSGIAGVTVDQYDIDRQSDTEVTVELTFDGDFDADTTLTLNIGPNAIAVYDGPPLTTQISVPGGHESITASTEAPLTEATLNGSTVTLTLSGRIYASSRSIRSAVSVSGIPGVTIRPPEEDCALFWVFLCSTTYYVRRVSDTEVTVTLEFEGDIDRDGTLTFTVGADAIAGYNGPDFTAQVTVTAIKEQNGLLANFPNPFNPETWIPYQLAKPTEVTITIYAINGQVVRRLELGHQPAGLYQSRSRAAYWDGRNAFGEPVASGVYFYTLTAGDFTATRKMLMRK